MAALKAAVCIYTDRAYLQRLILVVVTLILVAIFIVIIASIDCGAHPGMDTALEVRDFAFIDLSCSRSARRQENVAGTWRLRDEFTAHYLSAFGSRIRIT